MATWNDRLAGWLHNFIVDQLAERVRKWLPRSQAFLTVDTDVCLTAGTRVRVTLVKWERMPGVDRYRADWTMPMRTPDGAIQMVGLAMTLDAGLVGDDLGDVADIITGARF